MIAGQTGSYCRRGHPRSALFPEGVDAQGSGQTAAALVLHRGHEQHNGGDDEGKCLIQLGGHAGQPAQCTGESRSQGTAGDTQGVEEAEHEGAQNGKSGIPVGEDDQRHSDPAVAVDPAAGVEGTGHVQAHVVAADAHNAAAQADVQIFHPLDVDAHGVRGTGIFTHSPELQARSGAV